MNFVGAFVILTTAYLFFATTPSEFRYRITQVQPGKAADQIGILPGDVVVSANGVDLTQHTSDHGQGMGGVQVTPLKKQSQASIGKQFTIVVERPINPENAKSPVGRVELQGNIPADASFDTPLGVGIGAKVLKTERVIYSVPEAVIEAASDMGNVVGGMVMAPIMLLNRTLPAEQARPVSIVGITQIGVSLFEDRSTQGLFPFIRFAGLISMVLGLIPGCHPGCHRRLE